MVDAMSQAIHGRARELHLKALSFFREVLLPGSAGTGRRIMESPLPCFPNTC